MSEATGIVTVPLRYRAATRAGWVAAGALCCVTPGALVWWYLTEPAGLAQTLVASALGTAYGVVAAGALGLGRARIAAVEITPAGLAIAHDGLLAEPIAIPCERIEAILVDPRPIDERRGAARRHRSPIGVPHFLDRTIPVVSAAPSAHSAFGTASTPNVVVLLSSPVICPRVSRAARVAIRLATGRLGRYRGPRSGAEIRALRLAATDAGPLAEAAAAWGVLAEAPRDARYLRARTARR